MKDEAIYLPDNPALLAVLDGLPADLARYRDHAALLVHFACLPRWQRRRDRGDGNGFARLRSLILRRYIPDRVVKPLRNALVGRGVLVLDSYSAGVRSIGYRIADGYHGLPRRWLLSDTPLIGKRRAWRESGISRDSPEMRELNERRRPITDSMRATLDRLGLSAGPAEVEAALLGRGIDRAHLRYASQVIANRDHEGVIYDPFGWRAHSIVTRTTAAIRPYLRFDGEALIELDVRNAQPLILGAALRNAPLCATYTGDAQHSAGRAARLAALGVLRSVPELEVREFVRLCEAGQFYEALSNGESGDREKVKRCVFRDVFFGKVKQRGPVTDVFQGLWPGIYDALLQLKQAFGYKVVARVLQRMESTIMIDGVCGRLVGDYPAVRFLTIHDAALAVVDRGDVVRGLMEAEFERLGVRARVKSKKLFQNVENILD